MTYAPFFFEKTTQAPTPIAAQVQGEDRMLFDPPALSIMLDGFRSSGIVSVVPAEMGDVL